MMKNIKILFVFPVIFALFSCCSPEQVRVAFDKYQHKAIQLHIESSPYLNTYNDKPHTLVLCVYQLRDLNAFNFMVEEKRGISKLLDGGKRFDPSVTAIRRLTVQPGNKVDETFDRASGTRHIAVVAGYYFELQRAQVVRVFSIPEVCDIKEVNINLILGAREIQNFKGE